MPQAHLQAAPTAMGLIALGSNLTAPDGRSPENTLRTAFFEVGRAFGVSIRASRLFATPCYPPGAGPDYVNGALALETGRAADDVMAILHGIEAAHGRTRDTRWGMRTLDLDLIALGDAVLPSAAEHDAWRTLPAREHLGRTPERLILPHPRLQERAFVLVPLAEVAPDWVHPRLGLSVTQMRDALAEADRAAVVALP